MSAKSDEKKNKHDDNEQEDSGELTIINFGKKVSSEQTKNDNEECENVSEQLENSDYYRDVDKVHEVAFDREDPK